MDHTTEITIHTEEPLTENQLTDVAEVGGAASGEAGGRSLSTTLTVTAGSIPAAAQIAIDIIMALAPGEVIAIEVMTTVEADRRLDEPPFAELVGIAEVADMLGVTRQRASALQGRDGFPAPVAKLRAGPVWRRGDLQRFADRWTRQPGRPAKAG